MTKAMAIKENHLFLRTIRGEPVERAPCWLMRQAGRYDPEYQRIRRESKLELEQLFQSPDLAAKITVLPARLGVDALILFQDILTVLGPMGAPFIFRPGPQLVHPLSSRQDLERLHTFDIHRELAFVAESIVRVLSLNSKLPLIGFAGAPWTLAAFLIEGGSPHRNQGKKVVAFAQEESSTLHRLLEKITSATIEYLKLQNRAGVQVWQLFDSAADLLDAKGYHEYALPYQRRVFDELSEQVPRIIFVKDLTDISALAATGAEVLSLSHRIDLGHARHLVGNRTVLQGNVDNQILHSGTTGQVRQAVRRALREGQGGAHVLNLGHGILEGTPFENVQAFVDEAHRCHGTRS
jgi:uroporphyrinogen decarboxylase